MRYNNLQLLRVFAAVGVVVFHLGCHGPALIGVGSYWLGFPLWAGLPVPLFFALSGFVLTQAVQSAAPGRFLLARFLRLYPGFWLALAVTLILMRCYVFTEQLRWMIYFVKPGTLTLWPAGDGLVLYPLGIEWSLVYEVFLSIAVAGLSVFVAPRRLPLAAAVWLVAILVKTAMWPSLYSDQFPHWSTIALSGFNAPFLMGMLVYALRNADRRWAIPVLPATLVLMATASTVPMSLEQVWLCLGLAGSGLMWLAIRAPQLGERNPLVRLGDCTYGLFLMHVPLMFAVLYPAQRLGYHGQVEALWLAGAVAIVGGLVFGRIESAVHALLRPLAKRPLPRLPRPSLAFLVRPFVRNRV